MTEAVGSDTPPFVKAQVQDDGAISAASASIYSQSSLLSLAAAAAVAEGESE